MDQLSWLNWNLKMLVSFFWREGGKLENLEKNPRRETRTNNKLDSTHIWPESNPGHNGGSWQVPVLSPLCQWSLLLILNQYNRIKEKQWYTSRKWWLFLQLLSQFCGWGMCYCIYNLIPFWVTSQHYRYNPVIYLYTLIMQRHYHSYMYNLRAH